MADPDYTSIAAEIGLDKLRTMYPALTGAGVTVGQVEANDADGNNTFEVDPAAVGQPANNSNGFLTYVRGPLRTTTYNDGITGSASAHATAVAQLFYGNNQYNGEPEGVASGVKHVDDYEAGDYTPNASDKVVNLSFVASNDIDSTFDQAALTNNTIFVASAGNAGSPASPSTAYNVISVGASDAGASTATGPTSAGAAKPDISAPADETSFSAPLVSGAATVLVQAGTAGYGGKSAAVEADAVDFRTVKALLINGAVKPADYFSNSYAPSSTDPLNGLYGSGILNVYNSVRELSGGEKAPTSTGTALLGATPAFVASSAAPLTTAMGWSLTKLSAPAAMDATSDTLVTLTAGSTFVSTITWASDGSNNINHFSLTLFDEATGGVVAQSAAASSNVQQVFVNASHAGTYDLHVELTGSVSAAISDTYALAYDDTASPACFAAGTRIRTVAGDVAVEDLAIGDVVVTATGAHRPIRWLGRRSYAGRFANRNPDVLPVCFKAGSIGDNVPFRDLWVSPKHAMYLDGVLVPAEHLVNGVTVIKAARVERVDYHHVELDSHDVLLAEGAPSESFVDDAGRHIFGNAVEYAALYPDAVRVEAVYCAPRIEHGAALEAIRRRIAARAETAATAWPLNSIAAA